MRHFSIEPNAVSDRRCGLSDAPGVVSAFEASKRLNLSIVQFRLTATLEADDIAHAVTVLSTSLALLPFPLRLVALSNLGLQLQRFILLSSTTGILVFH
ncbi:hypothetical protein ASC76_10220 [Rhizobacter sp. Root404]|nr:hypothetical protein ASC76_10220 [Rhizobacter sp. Root404]